MLANVFHTVLPFILQNSSTDAFHGPHSTDLPYVDGVSVTHGSSPRKHIWTFASGLSTSVIPGHQQYNCPCAQSPGNAPPTFVGNDYYCESGSKGNAISNLYEAWFTNNRLWDGSCYAESNCCDRSGMPYFTKKLAGVSSDNLEVRLCADQDSINENVGVEKLVLYIR